MPKWSRGLRSDERSGGAVVVTFDQSVRLKGFQPSLHRPLAPTTMEDKRIPHDVVEMLYGWIADVVMLMECVRASDP